jgi:hypothetical protein
MRRRYLPAPDAGGDKQIGPSFKHCGLYIDPDHPVVICCDAPVRYYRARWGVVPQSNGLAGGEGISSVSFGTELIGLVRAHERSRRKHRLADGEVEAIARTRSTLCTVAPLVA